ncbi:MAG: S-adenosylmethionine:tRNA ribosyltransferase-isomerase [Nitrospirae bacterium]|nr:S-adenosylmethionine:tRNA ribosyltransferase-isomerase [Nitrospirota bacterium]
MVMKTSDFSYDLPASLIAQAPCEMREQSRLLVLHRNGAIEHRKFVDFIEYLDAGDLLIMNDSRVLPVRLRGKDDSGKRELEVVIIKRLYELPDGCPDEHIEHECYEVLSRGNFTGRLYFGEGFYGDITDGKRACFHYSGNFDDFREIINKYGEMPLPPYIKRLPGEEDRLRYQTVYARKDGSIAAPTAGLHFTGQTLDAIKTKGVDVRYVTLHVGRGTFKPVKAENVQDHKMDEEYFEIDSRLDVIINNVRREGKKVILVGTTTTRAVEAFMSGRYKVESFGNVSGICGNGTGDTGTLAKTNTHAETGTHEETDTNIHDAASNCILRATTGMFIYPGYKFKAADCLLTNFHQPRSTPLFLTAAFAGGADTLLKAYREAATGKYRFLSYGDAMLIK